MLEHGAERDPLDPLRRPVGRYFPAIHAPDFLGVALEEEPKEPVPKLIADPILEIAGMTDGEQTGLQPGEHAADRLKQAQLKKRFEGFQRIRKKLSRIVNA